MGSLYHLNAEEEFENEDYFKDSTMIQKYQTRGVLHNQLIRARGHRFQTKVRCRAALIDCTGVRLLVAESSLAQYGSVFSLVEVAAQAHLSPSRFRHLFVAQTGVSIPAYLLWARVEFAIGAGMAGRSWTAAAQEAGFADSAHLSRTCRKQVSHAGHTPGRWHFTVGTVGRHVRSTTTGGNSALRRRSHLARSMELGSLRQQAMYDR